MIKKGLAALLVSLGVAGSASAEQALVQHSQGAFSIQAPADWARIEKSDYFQLASPSEAVVLTASAWAKEGGSLSEFAEYRFSSVHDFYKAVSEPHRLEKGELIGIYREYEGVWPGESRPTYYVVSALAAGNIYVSLSFVTTRKDWAKNRALYERMMLSVQSSS